MYKRQVQKRALVYLPCQTAPAGGRNGETATIETFPAPPKTDRKNSGHLTRPNTSLPSPVVYSSPSAFADSHKQIDAAVAKFKDSALP